MNKSNHAIDCQCLYCYLIQADNRREQGNWLPANGGSETPFMTRSGRRLLYVWQPSTGKHAYLDCDNDIVLSQHESELALGLI